MHRIALIGTGGTIASTSTSTGVVATRTVTDLLGTTGLADVEVESIDLMTVGSYRMTPAHLRRISDTVAQLLERTENPVDGIVITHGTDTMEETAFLLDLVHADARPVVLTGAQRASDAPHGDGPRNLADAVAVAADPHARKLGTLVVFAGQILPAAGTRKLRTRALDAFGSTTREPLGEVADGKVVIRETPTRPAALPRPTDAFDSTRVDIIEVYPGADATLINAAVAAGARGIVLAGTGIGNANPTIVDTCRQLAGDGIPTILASRVPFGEVAAVYGHGGGTDMVAAGAILSGSLPATQARILLSLLLSQSSDITTTLTHIIDTYTPTQED
ncbi:asparaginase [Gordonia polyisoprenivorans]|uniref:asparaginase n=1 Tax=Gordonia polyisoprenivorans TaxID=84595 RepID=UPI001AD696E2|nr:asparaginase [Gordonia polyisoprenivorans]QTI69650.1 asparaginase [Gordonia polyisoprenivorans]